MILLNAQAIPYLKDGNEKFPRSAYVELLVKLLALFVDEMRFFYDAVVSSVRSWGSDER